ncbi:MAG: hypothetical protein H6713_17765 [Myxococcales bacterium]|nr:hypothetical protein [Myxococcales bacterium]
MSVGDERATGVGVGLVSLSLMLAELVLTRIFSVTIWYHFAFVAIAVALFGAGVGGLFVHLARARLTQVDARRWLAGLALGLSLSLVLVDLALLRVPPNWFGGTLGLFTVFTARLMIVFLLAATPFLFGGAAIALAILRRPARIGRLYAWDLVGAGLGCLLVIPALHWFGGPQALVLAGAVACLAAVVFFGRRSRVTPYALALALGLGALASSQLGARVFALRVAKGLDLRNPFVKPEWTRWNAHSHVAVLPPHGFRGWGMSENFSGRLPEQKTLVIDMNAMTTLTRFDGDVGRVGHTWYDLSSFAYRLRPRAEAVCVIGAGGGKDVLGALSSKAAHVWAVELNRLIVDEVMRGAYRDFTGGLYERDDVTVVVDDGRGFLGRTEQRFDVIQLSMVDTSAATAAGAYALTENSLYTLEAAGEYIGKLKPGGLLSISSMSVPGLAVGARLAAIVREGLAADRRARNVALSVLVLRHGQLYNVIAKRGAFTELELQRAEQQARELGFTIVYRPRQDPPEGVSSPDGADAGGEGKAEAEADEVLGATEEEFDEDGVRVLRSTRPRERLDPNEPPEAREARWIYNILTAEDGEALYSYLLSLPLDVSAPYDDRPFFFYQERLASSGDVLAALRGQPRAHLLGGGLTILIRVGAALSLLVVLFLLTPSVVHLVARARRKQRSEQSSASASGLAAALRDGAYVMALGFGFMFIELALLQRFGLYLSDPTLTLAVVLAVILLGGGLGSRLLAGSEFSARAPRGVAALALALVLAYLCVIVQSDALMALLKATRSLSRVARAGLAIASIMPLALVMGACLPGGLRVVAGRDPTRVPWLWAVNAATSVLGAVLATIVIMHLGVLVAGWVGVGFYVVALVVLPREAARAGSSSSAGRSSSS